jgi:hypothetical protein
MEEYDDLHTLDSIPPQQLQGMTLLLGKPTLRQWTGQRPAPPTMELIHRPEKHEQHTGPYGC